MKKKAAPLKPLTPVELELMSILWRVGKASVHTVQAELESDRPLAYTSVSTMLRILEQKGFVGTEKQGRGHLYFARLEKKDYEAQALEHVVARVFDGTPATLVRRLLDLGDISESDLEEIQSVLDAKRMEP